VEAREDEKAGPQEGVVKTQQRGGPFKEKPVPRTNEKRRDPRGVIRTKGGGRKKRERKND